MLPVLVSVGSIKIYTFGVFLVLAFFWGSFLLWRLMRLTSHKEEVVFDGLFIAIALGLFFARFFYVLDNFSQFGFSFLKFILINGYPGLSLYGGLLGAFFVLYLYFLSKKVRPLQIGDYFVPPLFISLAIGFLGRFFAFDNLIVTLVQSFLFFFFSFLSYRFLMLVRREKLFAGFNLVFFVNVFSLAMIFEEKKGGWGFPLFLFLTTSIFFLYYFRTGLFLLFNSLLKGVENHGSKIFKKGLIKNRGGSDKEERGNRKKD
jgi:phosphatidylglycerol:prolipoprotein diacylglycerol transferase